MSNQLISREALKKAFYELINKKFAGIYDFEKLIDNAPTVSDHSVEIAKKSIELGRMVGRTEGAIENQRPQGEWKVYARQGGIPISDYCTNCKYEMKWYKNKYNFCPNCGADMRGGAE